MCYDAPKCHGGKFIGGAKKGSLLGHLASLLHAKQPAAMCGRVGNIFWTKCSDVVYSVVWLVERGSRGLVLGVSKL